MSDIFKPSKSDDSVSQKKGFIIEKDGVKLKKGVVLTPEFIKSHQNFFEKMCNIFTAYPDLFLDLIQNPEMKTDLFPYQRLLLRAIMRFQDIYATAPRAFSKSFLTILGLILQCIFIPRTKRFIAAPFKTQSAAIAKEKITEIYERWPLLKKEVLDQKQDEDVPGNFGKDYVELKFKNGSVFMVVGTGDAARGGRKNGGLIDETRDHDGDELEKVVYPFLNVARRLPDGSVNPQEPNQQRIFIKI